MIDCSQSLRELEAILSENEYDISSLGFVTFETPGGVANVSTATVLQCIRIAVEEKRLPPFDMTSPQEVRSISGDQLLVDRQ